MPPPLTDLRAPSPRPGRPPLLPPLAQINIALPAQGTMKVIECDDEKKLVHFFDKKMAAEVDGSALGEEFSGYIFR